MIFTNDPAFWIFMAIRVHLFIKTDNTLYSIKNTITHHQRNQHKAAVLFLVQNLI